MQVGGEAFERLRVAEYVHGYTRELGLPQLPVKGVLIDLPEGKQARLKVLETDSRVLSGYRVYPVPKYERAEDALKEAFQWDQAAYASSAYYPGPVAELSAEYMVRGQTKQRLLFYPLRFKAESGELLHCERIRVKIDYIDRLEILPTRAATLSRNSGEDRKRNLPRRRRVRGNEEGTFRAVAAAEGADLEHPLRGGLQDQHGRGGDLSHHTRGASGRRHCRCGHRCARSFRCSALPTGSREGHLRP